LTSSQRSRGKLVSIDKTGREIEGPTKAGLAPVLGNVRQIVADNGPNIVGSVGGISIVLFLSAIIIEMLSVQHTINQLPKSINAMARRAGPSRWGRPQAPVNAVRSTLNLGSARPAPLERSPEGFETVWRWACALMYSSMTVCSPRLPPRKRSMRTFKVSAESRVQV
jgi:hypothetical protein